MEDIYNKLINDKNFNLLNKKIPNPFLNQINNLKNSHNQQENKQNEGKQNATIVPPTNNNIQNFQNQSPNLHHADNQIINYQFLTGNRNEMHSLNKADINTIRSAHQTANYQQYQQLNETNVMNPYASQGIELPTILNTAQPCGLNNAFSENYQNPYSHQAQVIVASHPITSNGNNSDNINIENEDNDGKHICWIIALTCFFGFLAGFYLCHFYRKIKRKELVVSVFLVVCCIMTLNHFLLFFAADSASKWQ